MKNIDSNSSLPRWLQVVLGIFFLPVCFLIIFMGTALLTGAADNIWYVPIGIFSLLAGIWMTALTIRLILNKQDKTPIDEKLPPWVLFLFAIFFVAIPVLSILTGDYFENPMRNILMTLIYFGGAYGAFSRAIWKLRNK
jgi:hypothetical protein